MLKAFGITSIFIFVFTTIVKANDEIERLHVELFKTKDLKKKASLYNELAKAHYNVNIDSIRYYARLSIKLATKTKDVLTYSDGIHILGVASEKGGNIEEAITYFIEALHIRDSLKNNIRIASSYLSLGNMYIQKGKIYEDESHFDEADESYLIAKEYYNNSLGHSLISKDSNSIYLAYTNLGFAFDRLYKYKQAIENYELCYQWLPKNKKESLESLITLKVLSAKSDSGILSKDDLLNEYQILTTDFKSKNQINNLTYCNINFAAMVWDFDLNLAENYLKEADSLASSFGNLGYRVTINLNLYQLNKERENYKNALKHHEVYSKFNSQIANSDAKSKFDELLIKYETEKTENELIQETSDKNKWRVALFISLVFSVGIVTFFLQRQRINRLKRKEEKDRFNREVNNLMTNQELASVEAMLQGQDTERQRIAEDLHDRLGNTLSAAKMYFEVDNLKQSEEKSNKAFELLDKAIDETRDIAQNLASGILSKFGLKAALNDLKETIEGTGKIKIDIVLNHHFDRFKSEIEIQLYRIVQEILSNALKHSNATMLRIELCKDDDQFILLVSDNGQGFEKDKVNYGMGIRNINARVSKLNGKVEIDSSKAGTYFTINFNILNNES